MPGIRATADTDLGWPEPTRRTALDPKETLPKGSRRDATIASALRSTRGSACPQSSLVWAWICSWLGIRLAHLRSCRRRHEAPRIPSKHASFAAMLGAHQPLSVPIVVDRSRIAPRDRWVNPEAAFRD